MITFGDLRLPGRFWAKVQILDSECWQWTGALNSKGYGSVGAGGRNNQVSTHRYVLLATTEIPDGMQVDHLCRNKACCNPSHLEIVTQAVNMQRAMRRVHCANGHLMSGDNIRMTTRGRRVCVTCARRWNRESAARTKRVAA
jgi:hypothetical protein